MVNINASPFSHGRWDERLAMLRRRVGEAGCALAYCNLVGGQDELVFDGASVVLGSDGDLLAAAAQFAEDLVVVDLELARLRGRGRSRLVDGERPGAGPRAARIRPLRPTARPQRRDLRGARARDPRLPA